MDPCTFRLGDKETFSSPIDGISSSLTRLRAEPVVLNLRAEFVCIVDDARITESSNPIKTVSRTKQQHSDSYNAFALLIIKARQIELIVTSMDTVEIGMKRIPVTILIKINEAVTDNVVKTQNFMMTFLMAVRAQFR